MPISRPDREDNDLVIIGAGGHARVVLSVVDIGTVRGLLDPAFDVGTSIGGATVLGGEEVASQYPGRVHVAIGDNRLRREIVERLGPQTWQSVVSATAETAAVIEIGEGSFVGRRSVLQPASLVGRHVIVNTGAIVEHDCVLGDFVHIGPGAVLCGGVDIGDETLVGAGAVIVPGVTIGRRATVGAGAVVLRDVADGETVVGNPARSLER